MRFQAPESLSEQIAQHLGQRIVVRDLKPGERIQELKVAGDLNVSRGSVREALLILERRHLVEIYPRRGAVVSELTIDSVNALYDIYIDLLCMLARKVLERWPGEQLGGVMGQVQEMQAEEERLNHERNEALRDELLALADTLQNEVESAVNEIAALGDQLHEEILGILNDEQKALFEEFELITFKDSFSSSLKPSNFPNSSEIVLAVSVISWIRSSASTTVPSLLFIFPLGRSTIP